MTGEAVLEHAWGKLNLTLDVTGRLENGYHGLRSVMQSVSLADDVEVAACPGTGKTEVSSNWGFLPAGEQNLAGKAASAFRSVTGLRDLDVSVRLTKRIPVRAGMGGGSSDAAAVLRALNKLCGAGLSVQELRAAAEAVGSDVPFCVSGGTALAEGRGEILSDVRAMPQCDIVLCKPRFGVSTAELFERIDGKKLECHPDTDGMIGALNAGDLQETALRVYNVFEDVLPRGGDTVSAIKSVLYEHGAAGASMTGTGPTVFGIFRRREEAEEAAAVLRKQYRDVFLTRPDPGHMQNG